tara:strand:- start:2073 stop:2261 length:189 start_codon:yes stop_codon:yes gene_type:complete
MNNNNRKLKTVSSSDSNMSVKDGIRFYKRLLKNNKIEIGGGAHRRLLALQKKEFDNYRKVVK